ncbi:hypothetical protein [Candidatus Leptofilum sp.]|uniref:hypothetical protein n=1 Tax=Candidatus Leptofilum sp. TaxID=3241576 RepID=UPI003B59DA7B
MTTRRPGKYDSFLNKMGVGLTVASLTAVLLGTRLLGAEPQPAQPTPAVIVIPAQPESGQTTTTTIELAPVPTAVSPVIRPITQSQSS